MAFGQRQEGGKDWSCTQGKSFLGRKARVKAFFINCGRELSVRYRDSKKPGWLG